MSTSNQLDSSIKIVTPENIEFLYEVAGPFRRMPAFLIDFSIRGAIMAVGLVMTMWGLMWSPNITIGGLLLLWFVLEWFYGGLFETIWNGQTPGKRILGLRVLSANGQPVNGLQAIMRNILRTADMMPLLPVSALIAEESTAAIPLCLVGLLVPTFTRKFQRLGDICCGTIVVAEESSWLFGISVIDDPRAAQLAEYIPADFEIPKDLSRAVATYIERRKKFSNARRKEIARHLALPLLTRWNLPADTSYDLTLCALYHRAFIGDQGGADETDVLDTLGASPWNMQEKPGNQPAVEAVAGADPVISPTRLSLQAFNHAGDNPPSSPIESTST